MIVFFLTNMIDGGAAAGAPAVSAYAPSQLYIGIGIRIALVLGSLLLFR